MPGSGFLLREDRLQLLLQYLFAAALQVVLDGVMRIKKPKFALTGFRSLDYFLLPSLHFLHPLALFRRPYSCQNARANWKVMPFVEFRGTYSETLMDCCPSHLLGWSSDIGQQLSRDLEASYHPGIMPSSAESYDMA